MTYSVIRVPATPGASRSGRVGRVVVVAGIAVAAWISFGRHLFGLGGDLTIIYAATLGLIFAALLVSTGLAVRRTARLGFETRVMTYAFLIASGLIGILLGLTLPDSTPRGLQTIISGATQPGLDIAIGIANPLGVIGIATAIIALVFSIRDSRGRITLVESWSDEDDVDLVEPA
ncbi:hypothetical protein GY21_10165 [Cryobacterium roopkundense]|nr:hypothetical protein GY21_10165 [Cryobacterium roopkundense]